MDFDKIIKKRHSSRSFKPKAPGYKYLIEAIDTTLKGPFAGNNNRMTFIIIEEKKTINEIAKHSQQTWISEAPALIVVCSEDTDLENLYGERGKIYARQQAGSAISTLILKLTDLGINSCWVGGFTDELIKDLLKIPQHIVIEAIIPVGYEKIIKGTEKSIPKKEVSSVLRWESWTKIRRPWIFDENANPD